MIEAGGIPPAYTDILRKTHMRKDGSFVDPRAEHIVLSVEQAATEAVTQASLVPPKKGYIYGIGSSQYLDVDPTEPAPVSLVRNLEMETRVGSLESSFQTMNSGMESIIAMQKLILQNLGYDPVTMQPSPNVAASNTTPATTPGGSVRNYPTTSHNAIDIANDEEEKDEEDQETEEEEGLQAGDGEEKEKEDEA
ncbi:unnamed protein product [Cochlearia groenlandica]